MTQYYLEKRTLSTWSHVTWYATEEEALKNFNRVAVAGNGYSWRVVKVEVVEEKILTGERPVARLEDNEIIEDGPKGPWKSEGPSSASGWDKLAASVEGQANAASWNKSNGGPVSSHGMVGKVWLGNPTTKEKKRVEPSMVEAMMKDGWVKAGPRTVL